MFKLNNTSIYESIKFVFFSSDEQMPSFCSYSPPELLDRHLKLGGQVHAKELSKIPITSQDSVSWTHFGGNWEYTMYFV